MFETPTSVGAAKKKRLWSHDGLLTFEIIAARVIQRRVRLEDYFRDFDKLRKGWCTLSHLKTVLGMLSVAQDLTAKDFAELGQMYLNQDGKFRYQDFCTDVNLGFGRKPLFAHPTVFVPMVDASTTAHARFNSLVLTPEDKDRFKKLEAKVRTWIMGQRNNLLPFFRDMDRYNKGVVKRPQFKRVLRMANINIKDDDAELLADGYCNRGNVDEVDYKMFLKAADPPTPTEQLASDQFAAPYQESANCNQYFDEDGTSIIPSPKKSWACLTGEEWMRRTGRPGTAGGTLNRSNSAPRLQSPTTPSPQRPMSASSLTRQNSGPKLGQQQQRPMSAINGKQQKTLFPSVISAH
jgi:Ca2+-binding EF-hand superfamily protein